MWLLKDIFYFQFWITMEYKEILNYGKRVIIRQNFEEYLKVKREYLKKDKF